MSFIATSLTAWLVVRELCQGEEVATQIADRHLSNGILQAGACAESLIMTASEPDTVFFPGSMEFEEWLAANGATATELWIRMAKKHTGISSLDWVGVVDVALCFGWIDGISKSIDRDWFRQRVTPRRARSIWSKVNREKVEALIAAGRMRPAGLAEVERAKADGRWDRAYDGMANAVVPDDLARALTVAGLSDTFGALSATSRYAILHRIQTATKPETRAARIERSVNDLADGKAPHTSQT